LHLMQASRTTYVIRLLRVRDLGNFGPYVR
jgi:hypothetical protein